MFPLESLSPLSSLLNTLFPHVSILHDIKKPMNLFKYFYNEYVSKGRLDK